MNCYFFYFQSLHLVAHKTFSSFRFPCKNTLIAYKSELNNQCGIFITKNTTWINYFEDKMPLRLHEVPVRGRNYHNNRIEFNIMHNNR